ncbi:MAG: hypothetical protein ACQGVC_01760 [Myxococcota bacterium]
MKRLGRGGNGNDSGGGRRPPWRRRRDYESEAEAEAGAREALKLLRPPLRELAGFGVDAEEARMRRRRAQRYESSEIWVEQELGPILAEYDKASERFRQFRERWRIAREPDERYQPENQVKAAGIIGAALFPESGVNLYAFGQHQSNVLAGALPAMLPLLIVLFTAFLTVQAARWVTVRFWLYKLLGGAMAVLGVTTALLSLIALGHYRDDYAANAAADLMAIGESVSFMDRMAAAPLDLTSMSWWLLLFSIAAFKFNCFHLWNADDPHPGFGKKARALDAAETEAAEAVAKLQNETKAIADACLSEAEEIVTRREAFLKKAIGIVEDELYWQGVYAPENYVPTGEEPPARRELLTAHEKLIGWREELAALGGLTLRLGSPPGEEPAPEMEPREISSLVHAVSAEEAWLWLDRVIEKAGFTGNSKDDKEKT